MEPVEEPDGVVGEELAEAVGDMVGVVAGDEAGVADAGGLPRSRPSPSSALPESHPEARGLLY